MQYAIAGWPAAGCLNSTNDHSVNYVTDGNAFFIDILTSQESKEWIGNTYGYPD